MYREDRMGLKFNEGKHRMISGYGSEGETFPHLFRLEIRLFVETHPCIPPPFRNNFELTPISNPLIRQGRRGYFLLDSLEKRMLRL